MTMKGVDKQGSILTRIQVSKSQLDNMNYSEKVITVTQTCRSRKNITQQAYIEERHCHIFTENLV